MATSMVTVVATDFNNTRLNAARLNVYQAGTTTPVTIYQDAALSTPSTNPAITDSSGRLTVWLDSNQGAQKIVLEDSGQTTQYFTQDNIVVGDNPNLVVLPALLGDQNLRTTDTPVFAGLTVNGNAAVTGVLTPGTLTVTNNATVGGTLGVTGALSGSAGSFTGNLSAGGNLTVTGTTNIGVLNATATQVTTLGTTSDATLGGALSVSGATTISGALTASSGLSVTGAIVVSGLVDGRDIAADGLTLDNLNSTLGLNALSAAEVSQLTNIDSSTISAAQWGYLGGSVAFGGSLFAAASSAAARSLLGVSLAGSPVASQAEAEAGTSNEVLITPLRARDAHTSLLASQAEAEAGTDNTKTMTPLRGRQQIAALFPTPQDHGAVGDGVEDDTEAVQDGIDHVANTKARKLLVNAGTYKLHTDTVTGSSGASPDDSAIIISESGTHFCGEGLNASTLRAQDANDYNMARIYNLPIVSGATPIDGGSFSNLTVDGNFNTDSATDRAAWTDGPAGALVLSQGLIDYEFSNLVLKNSGDYALGEQNGAGLRIRHRDLTMIGTMNDALDMKNNGNNTRDNSFHGIWMEKIGRGQNLTFPYAGLDLSGEGAIASHVWCRDYGDIGSGQAAVRFKQGETGDDRGLGGYKGILFGFNVTASTGGDHDVHGVHSAHRRSIVALGNIEGGDGAGVLLHQDRAKVLGLDVQGFAQGIYCESDDEPSSSDFVISAACVLSECTVGLRIDRDNGVHLGHIFRDCTTSVQLDENAGGNFILARSTGTTQHIIDEGDNNFSLLYVDNALRLYRNADSANVNAGQRMALGDYPTWYAPHSSEATRWVAVDDIGASTPTERRLILRAPSAANQPWIYETSDQVRFDIDGSSVFQIASAVSISHARMRGATTTGGAANAAVMFEELSSETNPVFCPMGSSTAGAATGLGGTETTLSLITGGTAKASIGDPLGTLVVENDNNASVVTKTVFASGITGFHALESSSGAHGMKWVYDAGANQAQLMIRYNSVDTVVMTINRDNNQIEFPGIATAASQVANGKLYSNSGVLTIK